MRIFERAAAAAAALAGLSACDPSAVGAGADSATVTVSGRDVTVAAPPGFCVDPASTNVGATGAFVMVTDCGLVGGRGAEGDAVPAGAAMTASVSAGGGAPARSLAEIERFARTVEGRAALGRSGRPDAVRIRAARIRDDVLYLLVEDGGPQPMDGVERQFWRAFLEVEGRMTVLSVLGFEGAGVGPSEGLAYVQSFADAIRRANPA